jgi:hypothetical protein
MWGPSAVKIGRKTIIYYRTNAATNVIASAESFDDTTFTLIGTALGVGGGATWDNTHVGYNTVFVLNGIVYVPYGGYSAHWAIGLSITTLVLRGTLTKEIGNPILDVSAGKFDQTHAFTPYILQNKETFYLYYTGVKGGDWKIGVATYP